MDAGGGSFLRRGFAGSFVIIERLCGENPNVTNGVRILNPVAKCLFGWRFFLKSSTEWQQGCSPVPQ